MSVVRRSLFVVHCLLFNVCSFDLRAARWLVHVAGLLLIVVS